MDSTDQLLIEVFPATVRTQAGGQGLVIAGEEAETDLLCQELKQFSIQKYSYYSMGLGCAPSFLGKWFSLMSLNLPDPLSLLLQN